MSDDQPVVEQRSRVKVSRTAKGDAQIEVSVVAGAEEAELLRIRTIALREYQESIVWLKKNGLTT